MAKLDKGQVLLAKDGQEQVLSNDVMISAFENSGWEVVQDERETEAEAPAEIGEPSLANEAPVEAEQ
ncbi:hypothetical protein [Abiotrophia defectiva]|uniref:hypothetical protein n=1 Tax=Abiotrophia defectiva TaxID=46125 RepID=UPI0028D77E0B|nr:hypothetical protein [Abiotrophia defectiva]